MKIVVLLCSLLLLCGCANNASSEPSAANEPSIPATAEQPSSETDRTEAVFSQLDPPAVGEEYAVITTGLGTVELRLFPEYAPNAVENFKTHARDGYYDGLIFHRVVKNFVIQTGDPTGTGMGGESIWGEGFAIEANQTLRHYNGALGMARNPNDTSSNGSQFYIVQNNNLQESIVQEFNEMRVSQDEPIAEGYEITVGELFPTAVIDIYLENGGTPTLDFGYTIFGQVISGMDVVEAIASVPTDDDDKPVSDVVMTKVEIREYGK